jgi:hypothetical protein
LLKKKWLGSFKNYDLWNYGSLFTILDE